MTNHQDCEQKIAHLQQTVEALSQQLAKYKQDVDRGHTMQHEFVVLISHELRTPVTIIKECVSQLQDRLFGEVNAEQEKLLILAMQNIDRLTGSINQFVEHLRASGNVMDGDVNML